MDKTSLSTLEKIILGLVLVLANLRALVFIFLFPDTSKPLSPAWMEIVLWGLTCAGVFFYLVRQQEMGDYKAMWRQNWLPALFILLAFLSILWSVAPVATSFRVLELFFATLTASYFGMRLNSEKMMHVLFWFGVVLYIISIALVYYAPPTGTMYWAPFNGAWRGVYWHRNHLASIAAFLSIVYLCRFLLSISKKEFERHFGWCFLYPLPGDPLFYKVRNRLHCVSRFEFFRSGDSAMALALPSIAA